MEFTLFGELQWNLASKVVFHVVKDQLAKVSHLAYNLASRKQPSARSLAAER
jgi:hypothetical protein